MVVVTIIVILLALLVPAMDKAIYSAELATCAARQRGNATVFATYAFDSKRYYPRPAGGRVNNSFDALGPRIGNARNPLELMPILEPRMSLRACVRSPNTSRDREGVVRKKPLAYARGSSRTMLLTHALKALLCPLLGGISYDPSANNDLTLYFSNYYLFFSQRYTDLPGNKGMYKVGDRWEHRAAAGISPDLFSVMLMDLNGSDSANTYAMTGHPDDVDSLPKRPFQNVLNAVGQYVTFSRWQSGTIKTGDFRGKVDLNFTYEDGSVQRLDGLRRDPLVEERTEELPYYPNGGSAAIKIYVPPGR